MARRLAYVLVRSWDEPDGYRPGIVQEGVRGASKSDFTLDLDINEAVDYLRHLNGRSRLMPENVKGMVLVSCPKLLGDIAFGSDENGL
jgi:hypothetical protein